MVRLGRSLGFCLKNRNLSLPSIGGLRLGNTHLTVMEANERVRTRCQTETSRFVGLLQRRTLLLQLEDSLLDVDG